MDNAELIAALRYCPSHGCGRCVALDASGFCSGNGIAGIMNSAADLIEAQAKRIVELNTKCADLQSQINSMENEIEELSPKEGEWIAVDDPVWDYFKCSICGNTEISNADKYCRGCGAKMKGEQE